MRCNVRQNKFVICIRYSATPDIRPAGYPTKSVPVSDAPPLKILHSEFWLIVPWRRLQLPARWPACLPSQVINTVLGLPAKIHTYSPPCREILIKYLEIFLLFGPKLTDWLNIQVSAFWEHGLSLRIHARRDLGHMGSFFCPSYSVFLVQFIHLALLSFLPPC